MPVNREIVGRKLRHLRQQLDISTAELAEATSIESQRIEGIEAGEIDFSGDELLILSDYFKVNYVSLVDQRIDIINGMDLFYRSAGDKFRREDRHSIQEFIFLCESENFLSSYFPVKDKIDFKPKLSGKFYKDHGLQLACQLRGALGFGPDDALADLFYQFRRLGFHIFRRKLGNSKISGIYIRHCVAGKCILINYDEDIYRQRFTLAHEVCHALVDSDSDFNVSMSDDDKSKYIEIRANNFASEFLLPSGLLRKIVDSIKSGSDDVILGIANRLQVNPIALAIALSEKCKISESLKARIEGMRIQKSDKIDQELKGGYSEKYIKAKESAMQNGLSSHYVNMCFDAYENNIISLNRLAYSLLCSVSDLSNIANLFSRKINA